MSWPTFILDLLQFIFFRETLRASPTQTRGPSFSAGTRDSAGLDPLFSSFSSLSCTGEASGGEMDEVDDLYGDLLAFDDDLLPLETPKAGGGSLGWDLGCSGSCCGERLVWGGGGWEEIQVPLLVKKWLVLRCTSWGKGI